MSRFETIARVMAEELGKPYVYGASDCFVMGCRVVDALLGSAHCDRYAGRYDTLAGAQRALRREGCSSLAAFFKDRVGLVPQGAALAQVGDLAILQLTHRGKQAEHVAIYNGRTFTTKTEQGPSSHGFDDVKICFKV